MIIVDDDGVMHKVVPVSVLEDIKAEIKEYRYGDEEASETDRNRAEAYNFGLGTALEIIDKHMESEEV